MARLSITVILMLAVLSAASCRKPTVAELDERERNDPAIQAAWSAGEAGDVASAQAQYEAIIRGNPENARAHLDLAMLLMGAEEKPLKSIYHFLRYLELRPNTEKEELITRNIRQLTSMLGNKVSKSRIGQLELQLALLQADNDALRKTVPYTPAAPVALAPAPLPPPRPSVAVTPTPARGPRLYTVQPGDSLSRIAQYMYGDGELSEKIYDANRGKLRSRNTLLAGQVLVIPP